MKISRYAQENAHIPAGQIIKFLFPVSYYNLGILVAIPLSTKIYQIFSFAFKMEGTKELSVDLNYHTNNSEVETSDVEGSKNIDNSPMNVDEVDVLNKEMKEVQS